MQNLLSLSRLRHRLKSFDWSLVKGSALIAVGTVISRALAMLFWLLMAQALTPSDYGMIQYLITVAGLVAILTQPFGQHVFARYIAKYRAEPDQLRIYLGNSWLVLGLLALITAIVATPVLLFVGQLNLAMIALFFGVTAFYTYWGVASGYESAARLTVAFLACNLVQLVVAFVVVRLLHITSPMVMTIVYALSYLIPVLVIQLVWPLPIMLHALRPNPEALKNLLAFFGPMLISHLGYILYASLPILLLETFSGPAAVGVFALATTFTVIFEIIDQSIATLFMPRAAAMTAQERGRQFRTIVSAMLVVNLVMLVGYLAVVDLAIATFFGAEYVAPFGTYLVLAIASVINGVHRMITAKLVGGGEVRFEAGLRIVSVVVTAICGWLLIPTLAEVGAAYAVLAGSVMVVVFYWLIALVSRNTSAHG